MEGKQQPSLLSVATFIVALATLMLVIAFALVDDMHTMRLQKRLNVLEGRCQ